MSDGWFRWLLDEDLPVVLTEACDAVHARDISRIPGPVGLTTATALDRSLVTCDQEFRGPWSLELRHPGIVVFEARPAGAADVERNLSLLEFRIRQYGDIQLAGSRYVLRTGRTVAQIMDDGTEVELAPWKQPRLSILPGPRASLA